MISYNTIFQYVSEGEFTPTEKGLLAADAATNAAVHYSIAVVKRFMIRKKKNLKGDTR